MPKPTTFTAELAAKMIGARRVGAKMREAASAAQVPWRTVCDWLHRGREWNNGTSTDPNDVRYSKFAIDMESATDEYLTALRASSFKEAMKDGRLAHEMLKWAELQKKLRQDLALGKKKLRVGSSDGSKVDLSKLTDEEVAMWDRLMKKAEL